MTMRPEDIKNRTFANALRGYDKAEVRSFLVRVAESSRELHEQLANTEAQVAAAAQAARDEASLAPDEAAAEAAADATGGDAAAAAGTDVEQVGDHDAGLVADVHLADSPATPDFKLHDTADLAATERSIADRYGALGDRIADLLRNADESAAAILAAAENDSAAMRTEAEAEAAELRNEAEAHAAQLLAEARAIRNEVDEYRSEVMAGIEAAQSEQDAVLAESRQTAEAEIENLRATAMAELDELRSAATAEADAVRSSAQEQADTLREATIADAQATVADREAETARLLDEAENDRRVARAELEEVRSEVSGLLEQARTQSEFIKQEADEIIRTKVRANFEQAQARIDVLRNTEVASRERIVRAQSELTSALSRLDSEPAPALDPSSGPAIIEEAERRQGVLGPAGDDEGSRSEPFSDDQAKPLVVDVDESLVDEAGILVGDDTDLDNQATFEADVAEASKQISADTDADSPLAAFLAPTPDAEVEPEAEPFGARFDFGSRHDDDQTDPETVAEETSMPPFGSTGFGAGGFGSGGATEHVVDDTTTRDQADESDDVDAGEGQSDEDERPGSLGETIPDAAPASGGVAEEDALARLVREAMQEAVDSARKND